MLTGTTSVETSATPEAVDLQQIPCVFHPTGIKVSFRVFPGVKVPEEASERRYHAGTSTDDTYALTKVLCGHIFEHLWACQPYLCYCHGGL